MGPLDYRTVKGQYEPTSFLVSTGVGRKSRASVAATSAKAYLDLLAGAAS
jgi:hypothetical protein